MNNIYHYPKPRKNEAAEFSDNTETRAIVDRLKAGMDLTQDLPDVKERLTSSGTDVVANVTPAQIGQFVCSQTDNNRKIIEAAAVKCE